MSRIKVIDLGLEDYQNAYNLQLEILEKRIKGEIEDTLILTEHYPVITLGRQAKEKDILVSNDFLEENKISVFVIERGGEVTFHYPGQIVGYPIISLGERGKDLHLYLFNLEEVIIQLLKDYNILGERRDKAGIWVKNKKIASIGIACKYWVTFHGFALNINNDLSYFNLINPCGLEASKMTSLSTIIGKPVSLEELKLKLIFHFAKVFEDFGISENTSEVIKNIFRGENEQ